MSAPLADTELDAIDSRAAAATLGPWVATFLPNEYESRVGPEGQPFIASLPDLADSGTDATFIAQARTDVPALVAEVRRLRALIELGCHCASLKAFGAPDEVNMCWCCKALGKGGPIHADPA